MCVKRNIVGRSRCQCCSKNATMHSVSVAELRVIVDQIKILSVAQQCFYGEFLSPATMKRWKVLM